MDSLRKADPILVGAGLLLGSSLLLKFVVSGVKRPPSPPGSFITGNLALLQNVKEKRNGYMVYTKLAEELGPIYQFTVPGSRLYMISDPKTIHEVLNNVDLYWPTPRLVDSFSTVAAGSLITLGGPLWRTHRKLIVGLFAPAQLRYASDLADDRCNKLCEKWVNAHKTNQTIDAHVDISCLVWDILGLVAFGHDFRSIEHGSAAMDDFAYVVHCLDRRLAAPKYLWNWIFDDQQEFLQRATSLRNVARDLILQRRKEIESGHAPDRADLLQRIWNEKGEDGSTMTDEQVINEMILFFIAGHETTANTTCWIVYRMSQKPELVERLRQEIAEVWGDSVENITYESLSKTRFLDAILKEALRIYPTVPLVGRNAQDNTELLGYPIEKGTSVILNLHAAHHNPALFPNPTEFDPYRWLNVDESSTQNRYYFPFGGGPKTCIGNKLAWVELKVAVVKLFHRFDISIAPDQEITPVHTLTLGPKGGMRIVVKPRY